MISWEDAYKAAPPWDIGRPQPEIVELVRAGELNKSKTLYVGCGTGENALVLAEKGFSVVGIDLSTRATAAVKAKAAKKKVKVDFQVGNTLAINFKNGQFDHAVDSGLFHIFSNNERLIFAREIARILGVDGRYFMLCFSDKEPANWGGPGESPGKKSKQHSRHSSASTMFETLTSPRAFTTMARELT